MESRRNLFCFFLVTTLFAAGAVAHADVLKILGAPGAIKTLRAHQEVLDKAAGTRVELIDQNPSVAMQALSKKLIGGVALAGKITEFFDTSDMKKTDVGGVDGYESSSYGSATVMAVLNPENPTQTLTREQVTDLLSGKLKTWESINGRKDKVKIIFNRAQPAAIVAVPRFYLDKVEVPNAEYVTTIRGIAEKLKESPGGISFSGSKFEDAAIKPKFIPTDLKLTYTLVAKKPLSAEMKKIFEVLKF
jgi:hypothetical protein